MIGALERGPLPLLALALAGICVLIAVDAALGRGDRVRKRLASVCGGGNDARSLWRGLRLAQRLTLNLLDELVGQIAALAIMSMHDRTKAQALLSSAGFRGGRDLGRYFVLKLLSMLLGVCVALGLASVYGLADEQPVLELGLVAVAVVVAGLLPEALLQALKRRRQSAIRGSLADAVDLMIIAANAGHSLDVALTRVGREMMRMAPQLADELEVTISELRALPSRRQALENFATRTGLPEVRSLTATLIQTIRYGTPLVQSLKALAQEMRQAKLLALEEHAARLPALLSLPLMLLIMPAIFVITAGPAIVGIGAALFR